MVNTIFLGIAIVASAIFLIQFIMSIFFGDLDTDTDIDADLSSAVSLRDLLIFVSASDGICTFLTARLYRLF